MTGTPDVINQLGALSYAGIWVVAFLSNIVIPVPEEIVLLALGYLSSIKGIPVYLLIPLVSTALLANDIVIYSMARAGSKLLTKVYDRFFKKRITKRGDTWMNAHMARVIMIPRFLMQLRFIGPFFAGQKHYPLKKFALYDGLAILMYVTLYILLGRYFHHRVELIIEDVGIIKNTVLIIVGVFLAYLLLRFVSRLLFKKSHTA